MGILLIDTRLVGEGEIGGVVTTATNQYRGPVPKPGPLPSPEPPEKPGKVLCSEPGPDAIASSPPGTSTKHQREVGGGEVVDKAVADGNGAATVDSGSDHRKADPETDGGPEYRWSCMEGHAYGSPHALASHAGKAKRKEGDHRPLGMVDTTTGQVVWKWSTTKEAYGLYKRLRAGETLAQALAGKVAPPGSDHTRPRRQDTTTATRTTSTTTSPIGTPGEKVSGTSTSEVSRLGGVLRPELWWLDRRLADYFDKVKEGLSRRGVNLTDNFPQFLFKTCTGFLLEHHDDLGLGDAFVRELHRVVQEAT